jgi:hypothetical protein
MKFLGKDRGNYLEVLIRLFSADSLDHSGPVLQEIVVHRLNKRFPKLVARAFRAAKWIP